MKSRGKWIEGLDGSTPIIEAARLVLTARFGTVARLLATSGERADAEYAHQLRVSTRRASAALAAFTGCLDPEGVKRTHRRLRRIRRAAGAARECDAHTVVFAALAERAPESQRAVIDLLRDRVAGEREEAARDIIKAARKTPRRKLRSLRDDLIDSARGAMGDTRDAGGRGATTLADAAAPVIASLTERLRAAAEEDLGVPEHLHTLRLRAKSLRYALEIFAPCFGPGLRDTTLPRLAALQDLLGGVNDMHQVVGRLDAALADPGLDAELRDGVAALKRRCEGERDERHREAVEQIGSTGALDFIASFRALLDPTAETRHGALTGAADGVGSNSAAHGPGSNGSGGAHAIAPGAPAPGPRRLGAIDVGTNSIRLLVAEAHPDGSYRVLDDEKEITRLGRGLGEAGMMSDEAMEHTLRAVERMKRIALGHGVHALRAIGTSACREAGNRDAFAGMFRARTGITLEVISPADEARLAYLSAAHSFDLRGLAAAVVDIGGGSTEIVLSAGGVTEQVYSLPLGAVRLTELFGGPDRCGGERFKKMRRHIKRTLAEGVGRPPLAPQLVIGAGGTFTTLANILIHRERGAAGPSLWDRGVPGHEAHRSDVRHVLDRLRRLPVRDRARVPGLPEERADIIVAGLAIVERVLKHLGVNVVRVHDRGIRDGLVLRMAEEVFGSSAGAVGGPPGSSAIRAVRRFAESCRYEAAHSEHVTRLALSIHAQLAESQGWDEVRRAEDRRLLEAAGVLHDVGYLVNYSRHHKHSYHLIVHSDVAGFSRREIEVIANVARYHRQTEPRKRHPNFAALDKADRELVRRLAAILRVADGLDRTHTQNTRSVQVEFEGTAARFLVTAAEDPATDLWGAAKKGGLFHAVFGLEPRFERAAPEPVAVRLEPASNGHVPAATHEPAGVPAQV
ncbi:MAG: CHAD domain-containing protein [Phycisphaerales bacterium]